MKIVHLCVSCFYIDGFAYQENELVAQNVADGHDVVVIASTETYGADRRIAYLEPGKYLGTDGAKVIRLPYRKFLPHSVMRKLRMHPGIYEILENEAPDVILFHGLCGWELNTAARYKRSHSATRLYVDSHEDFNNSARTWASKWVLHYGYYRCIVMRCLPEIDKILCVTVESVAFARDFYQIPPSLLELYPLGGHVFNDAEYVSTRTACRDEFGVNDEEIVFVQSGKLDSTKQLPNALRAFSSATDMRLRYFIAGHMTSDVLREAQPLIDADSRIQFLGWVEPKALRRLLCAGDVYVQPFGQTSTTQMSLCCRNAFIAQDLPSHRALLCENGFLVNEQKSLDDAFSYMADSANCLLVMQNASANFAKHHLDYQVLARRICC